MSESPSEFTDRIVAALFAGKEILDPLMEQHGFAFEMGPSGRGSGGHFATAAYVCGSRRIEFSYRWALGCVSYVTSKTQIGHSRFIDLIGKRFESEYVRFNREDPLAGFVALKYDLEHFAEDFLMGDTTRIETIALKDSGNPSHR